MRQSAFPSACMWLLAGLFICLMLGLPAMGVETDPPEKAWTAMESGSFNWMYLKNFVKIPWWDKEWKYRIPLVVYEPTGYTRALTLSMEHDFPNGTDPSSIRIVTPGGNLLPSQVKRLGEYSTRMRVTFLKPEMSGHDTLCVFMYFDDSPKDPVKYDVDLSLQEDERCYVLRNARMVAQIYKDLPDIPVLRARGVGHGNQLQDDVGFSVPGTGLEYRNFKTDRVEIVEKGPVRIVIDYVSKESVASRILRVRYIMDSGSPVLYYQLIKDSGSFMGSSRSIRWAPGAGYIPWQIDTLYYGGAPLAESEEPVGKLPIKLAHGDLNVIAGNLTGMLNKGWYAVVDRTTAETVGEIFEYDPRDSLKVWFGYQAAWKLVFHEHRDVCKGGLVVLPANTGWKYVERQYEIFSTSPRVVMGETRNREEVPADWQVPEFGKDIILAFHKTPRDIDGYLVRNSISDIIPYWIRAFRDKGANYIVFWPPTHYYQPVEGHEDCAEFLKKLYSDFRANGLGVATHKCTQSKNIRVKAHDSAYLKLVEQYGHSLQTAVGCFSGIAETVANAHPNIFLFTDEWAWGIQKDDTAEFKKIYGMDPVKEVAPSRLAEPAQHNTMLFGLEGNTKIIKAMYETTKKIDKKIITGNQVNTSRMTGVGTQDWEKMSDYLDTICMDLYGAPGPMHKYFGKLMLSMFNNERPIAMYSGCSDGNITYHNIMTRLMWGGSAVFHFPPSKGYVSKLYFSEAERMFRYLNYTGLGDLLASYKPAKHMAVLRDHAAWIDSIKKGQWTGKGSLYDSRIQNITFIRNMQTDIMMSKYLNAENLSPYSLLLVVSDPVLSDDFVTVISDYVEQGGVAVIEGETIVSPAVQKLTGVNYNGKVVEITGRTGGDRGFAFSGKGCDVSPADAEVLLEGDADRLSVFEKSVGKGRVIYMPMILSEALTENPDRRRYGTGRTGNLDAIGFYRELLNAVGGPSRMLVQGDMHDSVDSNLLADGTNFLLCLDNRTREELTVELKWHGERRPETLMRYSTGALIDFPETGKFKATLGPRRLAFYYMGDPAVVRLPKVTEYPRNAFLVYSNSQKDPLMSVTSEEVEDKPASLDNIGDDIMDLLE